MCLLPQRLQMLCQTVVCFGTAKEGKRNLGQLSLLCSTQVTNYFDKYPAKNVSCAVQLLELPLIKDTSTHLPEILEGMLDT